MRVGYLVHFRGGRETGIYRKVREHVTEWSRRGVEVGLFVATDAAGREDWSAIPQTRRVAILPERAALSLATRERVSMALRRWRPDVVYARHGLAYPGFILAARSIPTVLEINADDVAEFGLTSTWRSAYGRLSRSLLLRSAAGLVHVTSELSRSPSFTGFGKPSIVVANGIDLAAVPPFPAPANATPHLVFVGHPGSPWHGVEHVLELARSFPTWQFDLVGPSADDVSSAPPNVIAHGVRPNEAYREVLADADVAIGSLGLYRDRLEEASPLKVREYLARGIPTIIGYRDTDFPDGAPLILRVPNEPTGITSSLPLIEAFVTRAMGQRVPVESVAHLDVRVKEDERLRFLADRAGAAQ